MTASDYLYHYTSLESLALILKNRTIRFNSLAKMDDLQEKASKDIDNLGKYYFVSSWTSEKEESIPMWNMYGNPKSGVRIGMQINPFRRHPFTAEEFSEMTGYRNECPPGFINDWLFDVHDMYARKYMIVQFESKSILHEVKYTDNPDLLFPTVFIDKDGETIGRIGEFGIYKNPYWSFQKEWRYIFMVYSYDLFGDIATGLDRIKKAQEEMRNGTGKAPFDDFYLPIKDDAFEKMEITISPQMSDGNRVLLESIVQKYNPTAALKESDLYGKI